MQYLRRYGWACLSLLLALALAHVVWINGRLRERVELLEKLASIQDRWCSGMVAVNEVCEETLVDIMIRLGLDRDAMPLVTTALWKRAMKGLRVSEARGKLGAPEVSPGVIEENNFAIGGGSEEDERR